MRTAQQRLAEIERKQILLIKKARIEETRKTQKVGEFVREHMPNVEASQEFLAWLRTDIDKALFGVTIDKRERKSTKRSSPKAWSQRLQIKTDPVLQRKPASRGFQKRFRSR
jgi:hypothetical protein